jgi:hypothetical protein
LGAIVGRRGVDKGKCVDYVPLLRGGDVIGRWIQSPLVNVGLKLVFEESLLSSVHRRYRNREIENVQEVRVQIWELGELYR